MTPRPVAFISVGIIGFLVQMAVLGVLTIFGHWPTAPATLVAVEAAILTNFFWHERWTWRDRGTTHRIARLARFHLTNGATSLVGNTVVTVAAVTLLGFTPMAGNALAVLLFSIVNYVAADRWVFARRLGVVSACLLIGWPSHAAAAQLTPEAIAAWNRHAARMEATLAQHEQDAPLAEPQGRTIDVPGGTISEWRGSIVVHGVTVPQVVDALLANAGVKQEDVAEARVLERHGDSLRMYLKLVRRVIVTVTYDTEHDVQYVRRSQAFATSRSVSTRIVETGGSDRGFLWRLNSYWRYRQVGDAVQIDVLSLTLSRDIPWMVKPVAQPFIDRIGRESMVRTLDTVRQTANKSTTTND